MLIGQLGIEIHPLVKLVFFDLFLFATGYKVGPQFFRGLRMERVFADTGYWIALVPILALFARSASVFQCPREAPLFHAPSLAFRTRV